MTGLVVLRLSKSDLFPVSNIYEAVRNLLSTTVIATVLVFGMLIFFHELGHFITAKWTGMRVDEFALGFGPKLVSHRKGETLYSLRVIPLGGFNKIAGMDPDEEQDERSFQSKPLLSRILVIIAGSAMNFILPIVLFVIVFMASGVNEASQQPIIGSLLPDRPAVVAGLSAGDRIIEINGNKIDSWQQFVTIIQASADQQLAVKIDRNGQQQDHTLVPEFDAKANRAVIGVLPIIDNHQAGLFEAIALAGKHTYLVAGSMLVGIGQMITGQVAGDLAGPIGVAQMTGQVAQMGLIPLLQFTAFLSINLGLINMFPVPVLDGGYVVTLVVEGLRGKPLSRNSAHFVQMVGLALLLMLMLFATMKDIARLNLF
jgi:regulator of sigma E protease